MKKCCVLCHFQLVVFSIRHRERTQHQHQLHTAVSQNVQTQSPSAHQHQSLWRRESAWRFTKPQCHLPPHRWQVVNFTSEILKPFHVYCSCVTDRLTVESMLRPMTTDCSVTCLFWWCRSVKSRRSQSVSVYTPKCSASVLRAHNSTVNSCAPSDASLLSSLLDESSIQENTLVDTFWGQYTHTHIILIHFQ